MWPLQCFIGFVLAALSVVLAIVVIVNTIKFKTYTKYRFISTRRPSLILLYCIAGAIPCLLIITPLQIVFVSFHDHDIDNPFIHWLMTFVQEFSISLMSIVIALRCWLLYYDHSYQLSTVNKNWKGIIDPNDSDFWLENRKTWGDFGFIVFFGLVLATIVLMAFSIVSIYSVQFNNISSLQLTALFVVYLPCYTFIGGLIIYAKHKKTFIIEHDQFMIITEIQYLAVSTVLIIIICALKVVIPKISQYEHELLVELLIKTGEISFVFVTSWIQNKWVIFRLSEQNLSLSRIRVNWKKVINENHGISKLTMQDVLSTKHGFVMFMRHCQNEFNAEGLLFLSEVAQYKSKLNAENIDPTCFFTKPKMNVINKSNDHHEEGVLPTLNRIKSNVNYNKTNPLFVKQTTPIGTQMFEIKNSNSISKPKQSLSAKSDHEVIVSLGKRKILPKLKPLSLSDAATNSLKLFASNFGNKTPVGNTHNKLDDVLMADTHLKKEDVKEDEPCVDEPEPFTITYIDEDEKDETTMSMSIQNVYDYGRYLFMKYIDVESEFTINVSYQPRRKMLLFFSKSMENGFGNILDEHQKSELIESTQKNKLDEHQKYETIKTWLYHMFDELVCEVWDLLANDSFVRFMNSTQYEYLLKHSHSHRIINNNNKESAILSALMANS